MGYFGSMRKKHWSDGELAQRSGRFLPSLLNLIVWQVAGQEPHFTSFYKMCKSCCDQLRTTHFDHSLVANWPWSPGYPNWPSPGGLFAMRQGGVGQCSVSDAHLGPCHRNADPTVSGWPGGNMWHVTWHVQAMREIYYIWYSRCIYIYNMYMSLFKICRSCI